LFSVAEITERFPAGAEVFAQEDSNLDGQVCVKLNKQPQQGEGGVVEDNNAVGRG
jgi:hypothetical protein